MSDEERAELEEEKVRQTIGLDAYLIFSRKDYDADGNILEDDSKREWLAQVDARGLTAEHLRVIADSIERLNTGVKA